MKRRLDVFLVEEGYFDSREKAKREIMLGNVIINEQAVTKAGTMIKDNQELNIRIKEKLRYVSRGGLKLERALEYWELDFNHKKILDIGASTGGFTDCALQNGADFVYSVDVGKNQLDWKLRNDSRVKSLEEMHIRDLTLEDLNNEKADYIVIDVSFISLTSVFRYFRKFLKDDGKLIALIKPQFEVGKDKVGKNGIVKEEQYRDEAIKNVIKEASERGFQIKEVIESPITGTKGNIEYLSLFEPEL
jgi:23S rRNA (cytidine1920-2'-O)/16S rRNA (cytidine1409-2'-O)-methyltransferase